MENNVKKLYRKHMKIEQRNIKEIYSFELHVALRNISINQDVLLMKVYRRLDPLRTTLYFS